SDTFSVLMLSWEVNLDRSGRMFGVLNVLCFATIAVCIKGIDDMTLDIPGNDDEKQFIEAIASTSHRQSDYEYGSRQRCTYSFTVEDRMGSMNCGGGHGGGSGRSARDDDTNARLVRLQERLNNELVERQKYHERILLDMSESLGLRRFLNEKKEAIAEIPKLGLHLQRLFLNTSEEIKQLREEHALITEELNKRLGTSESFKVNQVWLKNNRKSRERYPFDFESTQATPSVDFESLSRPSDYQGQGPDSGDFPRVDQRRLFYNMSVDVQLHGRRLGFLEQAITNVSSRIDKILLKDKTEIEGLRTRFIIERSQRMTLSSEVDKLRDKMARVENQPARATGPYNCPHLDKSCSDLDYNITLLNLSHIALKGKVDNALQRHFKDAEIARSNTYDNAVPILKQQVEHLKRDHELEVNNIWNAIKDEEVERERLRNQMTTAMGVQTQAASSQQMQIQGNKIQGIEKMLGNISRKIETLQSSYLEDAHALEMRLNRAYHRKQQLMDDLEQQMSRLTQTHNQNDVFEVKAEINNLQDKLVKIQENVDELQQDVYLLKSKHMQQLRHFEGLISNITKDSNEIKREQPRLPSTRKLSDIEAQLGEQHEKYLHIQSAMLQLTTLVHDIKKKQSSVLEDLEEKFNEVDQENIIEQVSERMIKKKFDDTLEFHLSDQKIKTKHMEESLYNMTEKLKDMKSDHKNKTQDLMMRLYNEHKMRGVLEERLSSEEEKNANLSKVVKKQEDMIKQLDQQVSTENNERKQLSKLVIKLEDNVDTIVVKLGEQKARARYLTNKVQQTSKLKNNMTNLVVKMKEDMTKELENKIQSTLSEKNSVQSNMMSMLATLRDDLAKEIEHRRSLEFNLRDAISERESLALRLQDDLQKRETMYKKIIEGERQREHMNRHINNLVIDMNARAKRERFESEKETENSVTASYGPVETTTSYRLVEATTLKPRKPSTKRQKKKPQKPTTKRTPTTPKKKTTPRRPTKPKTRKPIERMITTTLTTTTVEPTKKATPKRMKTPVQPNTVPIDCSGYNALGFTQNGIYRIKPNSSADQFQAYCKHDADGGWTVIQRREDGSVDFNKDWVEYREGFGNPAGEHWLGNEHIYHLTSTGKHQLRVDIKLPDNSWATSAYDDFKIESEFGGYMMRLGTFLGGNAGDGFNVESSFSTNKDMYFSTKGKDQDDSYWYHCAEDAKSGWWYSDCGISNLNGPYMLDQCKNRECFVWGDLIDHYDEELMQNYNLETVMRIRRFE
ncbi:unnamed protein product, partial [Owenia fusiformis]